jgi:hypothetical protein
MLSSITPLGERGREATWGITMCAFVLGAAGAGALAGAVVGELGRLSLPSSISPQTRLAVLAAAVALALVLDASGNAIPGPRRQVNERWLDEYRGWVYGLGYGAQLGVGLTTVVMSAAIYVALIAAFLSANASSGALVIAVYGAIRGMTPLLAARVRTPQQLVALHEQMLAVGAMVAWGATATLGLILVLALALALGMR